MIDFRNIRIIAGKELRDSLRNRWFIVFTIAFAGLALALSGLSQPSGTQLQLASYNRTAASLVNLVLLFIPLISLTIGATNLAGDREVGTLTYLLAQPVNRVEVLLSKYIGVAGALFTTLTFGFGLAGMVLALQGNIQDAGGYLFTVILAYLLALAMLSLGFLIATFSFRIATALGGALFLWLFLVFIGDLGIMGTVIATQMPVDAIFWVTVLNPLQMFKFSSILTIQANLDVLGPAGLYATSQFGSSLLPLLLVGLLIWIVIPLGFALFLFMRQEKLVYKGVAK